MTSQNRRLTMKDNQAKYPQLRFKGFTDPWEQRKLGDITKISTGKLDANAMVENGKYDFYTSGIKKYRIDVAAFEGPSITIAGNGATVGYMHLADNKFNAYQRTYVLQEFLVDRSFIFSEIGNKLPKKIKQEARTGNIPYIVMDMLTELKLSIPQNNSEQQKIGSFFKQLDDTIALHQRKLDLLKEQKKGYLQKMFPKNGAKVPELRFAGFADDWEERKLGDYVIIRSGWSPSNFDINNNANNLFIKVDDLNYSTRVQEESQVKVNILSKYKKMKKSSTIFPKRGAAIMTNKVRMLGEDSYMDTNMMALEPKGIDPEYLYTFINKTGLYKIADTSTIPQINNKHIEPYLLLIPSLEEQHKIGSFFKQLDGTIALHQRKLDLLKEQKKGFLQNMFV
ncbi:hypothetical protein IV64_GL002037 [Lactiplantibacillus xiangfangensis]|uniref:Type I restriction modification DNA specificity domain-containing protein n=2 Tax=Lactiplantibacillus xiangfangensis TaxID=942150 RepID=A0A0R2MNS0_9LACO|nr:hypothetical protein IV64_GL002037 [Lactiplantibacillus xiangfangensis]